MRLFRVCKWTAGRHVASHFLLLHSADEGGPDDDGTLVLPGRRHDRG